MTVMTAPRRERPPIVWARRYVITAGVAALLGASSSMALPLQLDAANRDGKPLTCGSAFAPDHVQVEAEDQLNAQRFEQNRGALRRSDYAGECSAWISSKREAALGVSAGGAVLIAAAVLAARRRGHARDLSERLQQAREFALERRSRSESRGEVRP